MSARVIQSAALLLCLGALGCGSQPGPAPMDDVRFIAADEFDAYAELESRLGELARCPACALCAAVRASQVGDPGLASLVRAAAAERVPFMAWLLLAEQDGYWFNEENLPAARALVEEFLGWVESEDLPLEWLLFDMELHLEQVRQIEGGDLLTEVIPQLQANVDPEAFAASRAAYAELVGQVQQRGYRVTAAAYPFVIDDAADGDSQIQDAWNTPVQGVPFDEIYFMVYRTSFERFTGMQPGPWLVHGYARDAEQAFGPAGCLALGTVGTAGMLSDAGYTEPAGLRADIAAVRAGGNDRVFVYSLDGMLESGDLAGWLALWDTPAERPEPDSESEQVREICALMDGLF
ncbi:MAG: hypothetical protein JXR96_25520 [Deltaproteobacteria bacterium]|nr:hypothetical protein [Deltaproteobacteria bacterium]